MSADDDGKPDAERDDRARARDIILRRRRQFIVASAMAGIVGGCEAPQPCLSIEQVPQGSGAPPDDGPATSTTSETTTSTAPQVCLKIVAPPDAGTGNEGTGNEGTGNADAGKVGPKPPPKPQPAPKPSVCLRFAPPIEPPTKG